MHIIDLYINHYVCVYSAGTGSLYCIFPSGIYLPFHWGNILPNISTPKAVHRRREYIKLHICPVHSVQL